MAALRSRTRESTSDEALIRSLYEEHGRALLAYATRLTGDRAAAEDIVQETLIRAWRHPEVLVNGKGSVRGWLLTVTRNIVTDRYRARAARPAEVAETTAAAAPAQADHAEAVVDTMVVMDALDQLSSEHRNVLMEIYYQGRSVTEAAQILGIPAGTVKSRSHYALKALRELFAGRAAGAGGDDGTGGAGGGGRRSRRTGRHSTSGKPVTPVRLREAAP
ncbi:sigma-70 family RNA polymerase sigma factor [Streptomyces aidingensis]|uniref:RNA polymerase sigma-70 factor, ECF subfamily n=1 Tax=Streptomyces aidingensis TaxID=910347 RepID=A0A1I1HCH8_9ACTN|nr:sigma-70 family RNA polymerase sigma factor [Streptomyces aidingensis]SFC21664.1 RNA polymerase sigma-70 factor, ECF subfamily [Streptomyces aidingensis]